MLAHLLTLEMQKEISSMELFICCHCGSKRENHNSWKNHERCCSFNHNRVYKNGMTGKKGSNQYTKAKRLNQPKPIKSLETLEKIRLANTGRKHSQETKEKISKARRKYLTENPDMVPYKLNHYSKGPSYPERYWKKILNKANINYVEQYQIHTYQLDFALVERKIDIEIDGDQHYLDQRIVESDKRRNEYLESLGWKIIRIRWSEYKKIVDKQDRIAYVNNIINEIQKTS